MKEFKKDFIAFLKEVIKQANQRLLENPKDKSLLDLKNRAYGYLFDLEVENNEAQI